MLKVAHVLLLLPAFNNCWKQKNQFFSVSISNYLSIYIYMLNIKIDIEEEDEVA